MGNVEDVDKPDLPDRATRPAPMTIMSDRASDDGADADREEYEQLLEAQVIGTRPSFM